MHYKKSQNSIEPMNNMTLFSKKLFNKPMIILIIILLLLFSLFEWTKPHSNPKQHNKRILVKVKPVKSSIIPISLKVTGTIEPQQSVTVNSQVSGIIKKIAFQPGQTVQKGQLLFVIDAASLRTSMQQAAALLERDEAQYKEKSLDAHRFQDLVQKEYVTRQQYDQAIAAAKTQLAIVDADKASLHQAQIQLNHAKIHAPVTGKTGNINLKVGDLVHDNDQKPLVIINQLEPLLVDFSINQNELSTLLNYQKQGTLWVAVYSEDNKTLIDKGPLVFIDNTINQQTGNVLLKAQIPNTKHLLWPGMMVDAELILSIQKNALVVPLKAVQLDDQGSFVYLDKGNKAILQRIIIARQYQHWAVISKGLSLGDKVITVAPPNLSPGSEIRVVKN